MSARLAVILQTAFPSISLLLLPPSHSKDHALLVRCRPMKLSRQGNLLGTFDCILNRHCRRNVPMAMKPLFCLKTRSHICDMTITPRRRAPGYCNHGVRPAQNPMTVRTRSSMISSPVTLAVAPRPGR